MNRKELINQIAAHTAVEPKQVTAVVRGFEEVVAANMAKGENIVLSGFAKFVKRDVPARMVRNPQTGEMIRAKAKKAAKITPLKGLKDVVMGVVPAPKLQKAAAAGSKATTKKSAAATKTASRKAPAKKATAKKATTRKTATAKKTAARRTTKR